MDNLSKARILAVTMIKMIVVMLAFLYGLHGLYVLVTQYLGLPFPRFLYGLLLYGGFGVVVGWAGQSFKQRTGAPEVKGDAKPQ